MFPQRVRRAQSVHLAAMRRLRKHAMPRPIRARLPRILLSILQFVDQSLGMLNAAGRQGEARVGWDPNVPQL